MQKSKMNQREIIILIVTLFILSLSCKTFQPDKSSAPDLVISRGEASMPISGTCLEEYGNTTTKICVQNRGLLPAGAFTLQVMGRQQWALDELGAGEEVCFKSELDFSGAQATADFDDKVSESNEDNNTFIIPVPTPPVLCTPVLISASDSSITSSMDISYQGVSFSFEESLASSITSETVPVDGETTLEIWAVPEHYLFTLNGYPLLNTFHEPQIRVFPVQEYRAINPNAGETINQLEELLENKSANPENIPFLPVFNAAQLMQARVKYINLQNISGVRFLTQYGQDAGPINNQDMFYTFQGLTSDGQYYISAVLPISNPSLPHPDTTTMDDTFYENFMNYVADMETNINALPEDSFSPPLTLLDAMLQSFSMIGSD